jgi:FkbM family methyltransferase
MILLTTTKYDKYPKLFKYIKEIDENSKIVNIDEISYINIFNTEFKNKNPIEYNICIEEYFSDDSWDMLDLNNRNIIDIGANVADTALYFAKNGANVIAFEPVKHLYELGLNNISLNPTLKNNIQLINKAVGGKRGKLTIGTNSTKSYSNNKDCYSVEVITVNDVLNEYNFPVDILKMDCEGCEFEIILNEDLTMFTDIVFEHHSKIAGKDYKPLIEKLKKDGFKIDTYSVEASKLEFEDIGIIHAFK